MYETPPVIIAFQKRLWQLINLAHTSDLWAAAFVINGGCSDDAFMDFKHWLVSIGKSGYYNALKNPDGLIKFLEKKASFVNYTNVKCDNLAGVAEMAYRFRTLIGQVYQKLNTMEKLVLLIGKPRNLKD